VSIESFERLRPQIHSRAFVHPAACLIGEVTIGDKASVWPGAVLRGDHGAINVGAGTSIQDGCVGHATNNKSQVIIGKQCTVGHRVVLHGCMVADHCLVGMGSVLLDLVELGEWCFVGAGSLLTPGKKFPARSFILGAPARRIREISGVEQDWIMHSYKSYVELARQYRARKL
jgi:carbonic anhydrase/acetyltransferase-like protein (isoleucine patch superfamily)